MDSPKLCGVCHEETYEQWQNQRAIKDYPTCHGCHGASVERPHTKGTNFFSNFLVFFEPVHSVRSHNLMLPDKLATGGSGIVGRPLVEHLLAQGHIVIGLCRNPEGTDTSQLRWIKADVGQSRFG